MFGCNLQKCAAVVTLFSFAIQSLEMGCGLFGKAVTTTMIEDFSPVSNSTGFTEFELELADNAENDRILVIPTPRFVTPRTRTQR